MSTIGPQRTFRFAPHMSASGGKADWPAGIVKDYLFICRPLICASAAAATCLIFFAAIGPLGARFRGVIRLPFDSGHSFGSPRAIVLESREAREAIPQRSRASLTIGRSRLQRCPFDLPVHCCPREDYCRNGDSGLINACEEISDAITPEPEGHPPNPGSRQHRRPGYGVKRHQPRI